MALGPADNRHRGADQWLLVMEGSGACIVNARKLPRKHESLNGGGVPPPPTPVTQGVLAPQSERPRPAGKLLADPRAPPTAACPRDRRIIDLESGRAKIFLQRPRVKGNYSEVQSRPHRSRDRVFP